MRKSLVIILSVLYITLTSGVAVNLHYCMGKLASVEYGHTESDACDRCGMEEGAGCCDTERHLIKADDEHLHQGGIKQIATAAELAMPPAGFLSSLSFSRIKVHTPYYLTPPDFPAGKLHILNGVFRI